jgi:hypothetical protein
MRVSFNKNAWHVRLQRWTFGDVKLRPNLCPHFWLTVFCIVAVPFVLLLKGLIVAGGFVLGHIGSALDRYYRWSEQRRLEKEDHDLSVEASTIGLAGAYRIWKQLNRFRSLDPFRDYVSNNEFYLHPFSSPEALDAATRLLERFQQLNPDWKQKFDEHAEQLEAAVEKWRLDRIAEEEARRKKAADREVLLNKIAYATQRIFKVLQYTAATAAIAFAVYIVGLGAFLLITNFWTIPWLTILICIGSVVVILIAIAALVMAIKAISDRASRVPKAEKKSEPGLLKTYLKAAKENYCPSIDWKD